MSDFITPISSVAALRTWWDSTVPATVPSGDNYIAELAAGSYDMNSFSGTSGGKTVSGSIIIRPQTAAKLNTTSRALRASSGDGVYLAFPNTNVTFTSANVIFDGVQIASGGAPSATLSLSTGGTVRRCIVSDVKLTFDNNGGSILDSACLRSQSDVCAWLPNSCTVTGSTFAHLAGGTAVATGTAITSKNNVFASIGGSAAFSGSMDGSSSANAFNVGTTYGTSPKSITATSEFTNVASLGTADLRLKSGTSLGTGAVAGQGTGTDVYYQSRAGSIGANEYVVAGPANASAPGATLTDTSTITPGTATGGAGGTSATAAGTTLTGSSTLSAGGAAAAASGSFTTSQLENNTASGPMLNTAVVWTWVKGSIGSAPTSMVHGSGTTSGTGTLTAMGLPTGPGYLLYATPDFVNVGYEAGTVT